MSATFTPLPSPTPGLGARVVQPPQWSPLPAPYLHESPPAFLPQSSLPSWPAPLAMAAAPAAPSSYPALAALPSATAQSRPKTSFQPPQPPVPPEADFTDDDLREAFGPIVEQAVRSAVFAKENGMDSYLEPMLRATIRRALAEYSPASRPFRQPAAFDRFVWHLQALFTSSTYEEILFEKTHRFQVEEVFLVDAASLALVSYASSDPARHSSAKRVASTVHRLAMQMRDHEGTTREFFELPDQRNAITRSGRHVILIAVVRGRPSELVLADIEFALRRIEGRFQAQFQQVGSPLLHILQPFLEDCLLIQSPASAA